MTRLYIPIFPKIYPLTSNESHHFAGYTIFVRTFFPEKLFSGNIFPVLTISCQKFFRQKKLRPKNFWVFQHSDKIHFRKIRFREIHPWQGFKGGNKLPVVRASIFQRSWQKFLNVSTFNSKISRHLNVQAGKFCIGKHPDQTNPGDRMFNARVPGSIVCAGICYNSPIPSERDGFCERSPGFVCDMPEIFGILRSFAQKIPV